MPENRGLRQICKWWRIELTAPVHEHTVGGRSDKPLPSFQPRIVGDPTPSPRRQRMSGGDDSAQIIQENDHAPSME